MKNLFFPSAFLLVLFLSSCNSRKDDVNLKAIDLNLSVQRFEQDLFKVNPDSLNQSIPNLRIKYGSFFNLFGEKLIGIGSYDDPAYPAYLHSFVTNPMVLQSYKKVNEIYPEIDWLTRELEDAFKRFHYYFPERVVPSVYTFISGYNQSVVITDSILAIGLERYLGADYSDYKSLGIPVYLSRNMKPEKISSDCIRSWVIGEFPFNDSIDNLVNNMVYEGMLMYLTRKMLPDQSDSLIFGFSPAQFNWCEKNERMMWTYLIDNKLLFTTDSFLISKMVNSAPFTSGFPQESPGRAAVWLGYRIVQSYIRNNQNVTPASLMKISDYQQILNKSKYKP